MKILWLSHLVPYPPRSGVAQRSYGLLRELAKRNEVTLFAFHQPALMQAMSDDPVTALAEATAHLEEVCAELRVFEIPWDRTPAHRYALALSSIVRRHPFSVNWLESREYSHALMHEAQGRSELVHFDTISLAVFRRHIDWAPCVMNHHNIESHLLLRRARKTRSPLARAYFWQEGVRLRHYEQRMGPRFALHVTCSELDQERLLEDSPDINSCVIPNGVDIEYFLPETPNPPAPTFAFVGTLGWGPNRDAALYIADELWPALRRAWPDARLCLAGSNPPEAARQLAMRDEHFEVPGFVEDVRPIMRESTFFICPIRDGGGTKLKILNAMAMGMIVIADPIACEGIDVTPGDNVILARSTEEYVHAAKSLLGDPAACARIGRSARQLVESRYAYEVIGLELDRQYRAISEGFEQGGN